MGDANERLREVRDAAGFKSALSAAKRFHWKPSTYGSHENGQTPNIPVRTVREGVQINCRLYPDGRRP